MEQFSRTEFEQESEVLMENYNIYNIFKKLTQQLILEKPENPLSFMIEQLEQPIGRKVFIIGAPGSGLSQLAQQLASNAQAEFISIGNYLKEKNPSNTSSKLMVSDQKAIEAFEACIKTIDDKQKTIIIEGFPKTETQALYLKNKKILPDAFIVANINRETAISNLQREASLTAEQAEFSLSQHDIFMPKVIRFYQNCYQQIDLNCQDQSLIVQKLLRIQNQPVKEIQPKRAYSVLIIGPAGSGRTSVARTLAQQTKMSYVSSSEVLSNFIQKQNFSEEAQRLRDQKVRGEQVEDEVINGLMAGRLIQPDVKKQGVILEGYPQTSEQAVYLEQSAEIYLNVVFLMKVSESTCIERLRKAGFDYETNIKQRLAGWEEQKQVITDLYQNRVVEVNAENELENVINEIQDILKRGC